jgi:UDP-glucose 4-epimerase
MKLLVTGGAGYIGSHVAHQLVESGHEIVVLDNLYSGHRWAVPAGAQFVEGDVANAGLVDNLLSQHRFDGVLHFAAHIEVGESVENPVKYYRNNTLASMGLFEACRREKVSKIIFSSTAAVYGEPVPETGLSESSPLRPANPYGASKQMSERILQDLAAASGGALQFVILRYFNAAGARADLKVGQATPRATHLIKVACETSVGARETLTVHGRDYPTPDGTCLRDYVHVVDVAQAHLDALAYLEKGGASDIFNVGYGRPTSVLQVLDAVKRASGRDLRVTHGPRRPGDPTVVFADNSKIRRVLGWKPKHDDLDFICRTAFEWESELRKNPGKFK